MQKRSLLLKIDHHVHSTDGYSSGNGSLVESTTKDITTGKELLKDRMKQVSGGNRGD